MTNKTYDIITYGRSSIDLYSNNIGAPFVDISEFGAFVGGSPLNISVGCSRLGLNAALLTGVGDDQVADFIINFLKNENVETKFIPRIKGSRSSAVILGIEPPDKFPLVYYRDNAADSQVGIDDVIKAEIKHCRLLEISATALNREPSRSAAFFATEEAVSANVPIVIDLDFRADQWHDPRAFGITTRAILSRAKIAIGTEEEVLATVLNDPEQITIKHQQISAPEIKGNIENGIQTILDIGVEVLVVKRGADGCSVYEKDKDEMKVPGFPVQILNILGAGDAFASGYIYGFLKGWDHYKAARMGNACGAIVVTRNGCANFMPYEDEALNFIKSNGGF